MSNITRRLFLSKAPLAAVAVSVPALAVAAQPEMTAQDRANFHYAEFVKAMGELTSEFDGWVLYAGEKKAFGDLPPKSYRHIGATTFGFSDRRGLSKPLLIESQESFKI